jgi:hypothetical protein
MFKRKYLWLIILLLLVFPFSEFNPQTPNLILTDTTITTTATFIHPVSITAGPNFIVANTGNATFITGGNIYLRTGVSVALGGRFSTVVDTNLVGVEIINGDERPDQFSLYQNYPNPFNPVTTFTFDVPYSSEIELAVFDVLGNVVTVLVNDYLAAGNYQVHWTADLPSGVYFYQLKAESFVETKKLVLLK